MCVCVCGSWVFCLWKVLLFDFELSACLLSLPVAVCARVRVCALDQSREWPKQYNKI